MEPLLRLREPAALTAIIVLAARVLIAVGTAVVYAGDDTSGGLPSVAVLISYRAGDATLVAVLTGLVATCVLTDRTRHARALTMAAVIVVTVSGLVALTFAVMALGSQSDTFLLDTFDLLANLAVPVLGLITLVHLLLRQPKAGPGGQPYALPSGEQADQQPAIPAAPDPQYQPTWQPDVAAGASWLTAGDAAAGAPASGWGTPGQQGGWQYPPPAQQPPPPQQAPPQQAPPQQAPGQQTSGQQPPAQPPAQRPSAPGPDPTGYPGRDPRADPPQPPAGGPPSSWWGGPQT